MNMHKFWIVFFLFLAAVLCGSVFLLLRRLFFHLVDKRIERFQNDLITRQTEEIRDMYRQMQEWRHDYNNHLQNIKNRLNEDAGEELEQYLDELAEDLKHTGMKIKTGNVMADAVLNSKLSLAEQSKIRLNIKAKIPQDIPVTDVELCSVLGNLLDNALEANAKLSEEERFLRVYMDQLKGQFYLSVQNASPKVRRERGLFRTTKEGSHGFGISRIDRIAKKYGGYVNRQYEEGVFATEIMLPLSADI